MNYSDKCRKVGHHPTESTNTKTLLLHYYFFFQIINTLKIEDIKTFTFSNVLGHFCFLVDIVLQDADKLGELLV
jgi:hypothetical protein